MSSVRKLAAPIAECGILRRLKTESSCLCQGFVGRAKPKAEQSLLTEFLSQKLYPI